MKTGFIHGRFQPFHNAHMVYAQAAAKEVDLLIVGITACFPSSGWGWTEAVAPSRSAPSSNPLTFHDRFLIIDSVIENSTEISVPVKILPFPIETPNICDFFIPQEHVAYTTVKDPWNLEKISMLKSNGYDVEVVKIQNDLTMPHTDGQEIRSLIRAENSRWEEYVPEHTASIIKSKMMHRF